MDALEHAWAVGLVLQLVRLESAFNQHIAQLAHVEGAVGILAAFDADFVALHVQPEQCRLLKALTAQLATERPNGVRVDPMHFHVVH